MSVLEIASHGVELLDDPAAAAPSVRESLRNIARANRWLGGAAAVRHALGEALRACGGGPFSLLDVGTGTGDLPRMASEWARKRSISLSTIGLEVSGVAARMARQNGLSTLVGDGGVLPFRDRSVDFVLLSQVAHHFSASAIVRLLAECARVARRALIVCDLHRSVVARWTFPLAAWALRFDPHTVRDGVTSLRRGFTARSLTALLDRAGVPARVVRRPGARLVAVADVGGRESGIGCRNSSDGRHPTSDTRPPKPETR